MSTLKSSLELGEKIGQGHFGEVFLANDPVHGVVAVKRLVRDPTESAAGWRARKEGLLREAQHLKQATHRNVVQVYHLLEDDSDDAILYVMDYCEGGSLQAAFERGPMPLSEVRKIATEVTQGLQALHTGGMLHRDIKPGNLLLDGKGVARLGDFGLVTDNLILGYGSQAGYLDHLAPEVHAGSGTSAKTDIWALGVTIYRLLHGALWYAANPPPADIVPNGGFVDTLRWLPHVPKKWRRVVRAMLQDDPARRYQTATAVFGALSELPVHPDWKCTVAEGEVRWERSNGARKVIVVWERHSSRRHEWRSWSEPIGKGRSRKLDGSNGPIGRKAVERELNAFFEA